MKEMTEEKETELVKRFLSGDESAFNKIFTQYSKKVYWHARKMLGSHEDADEVTQEVFITVYKKLSSFNFNSSLFTWIYRIASNKSINHIRKRRVKDFFSLDDVKEIAANENPGRTIEKNIDDAEKLNQLERILKTLPPKQREVFIFRHFDDMSYPEIAEITGKSVGALKANYFHALNKVKEKFDE